MRIAVVDMRGVPLMPCTPGKARHLFKSGKAQPKRRQLQKLQPAKGGVRKPEGSTRSLGLKRGTLVQHPKYGRCTVGGFDRQKHTISLNAYRTNKRLTQHGQVKDCSVLTWVAFRSWLIAEKKWSKGAKKSTPHRATKRKVHSSPA